MQSYEARQQQMPKSWTESITAVVAILGAIGTCIGMIYRYVRKAEWLEAENREIRKELAELTGTVKAHDTALASISQSLAGITAKLDMLIHEKR